MSHWVAEPGQLDMLVQQLDGAPLALDTEFIRERTYYPKLALVQLRAENGAEQLIDPLALPDAGPLGPALQADTLKIMHSPGEDFQALQCGWNLTVAPLFDTQLAAALTGLGAGLSYQNLVETVLGIHLEKGETRSDWMRRPLSPSQCLYAADDVRHLHALYDTLSQRLTQLGRHDWLSQDCARMVDAARDDTPDSNPHLSSRSAQRMEPDAQARLRRLLLWRETMARTHDKPRSWILDNELIVHLALKPFTRSAFEAVLERSPRAPRRTRSELWAEVSRPLEDSERDIPLAVQPDPALRQPLKAMQTVVAHYAAELDIPEGVLCSKRHLDALLASRTWPVALEGWRGDILKHDLLERLP